MLVNLVAVKLLRAHLCLCHISGVTKHYSIVLTDSTNDIGLSTRADPNEYLVGFHRVDDLEFVRAAIWHDNIEFRII